MATPKFKKQYDEMLKLHKNLFETLKTMDPKSEEFKDMQLKVIRVVRKNEDALCSKTENSKFSNFSMELANKFMDLVREDYPQIDY